MGKPHVSGAEVEAKVPNVTHQQDQQQQTVLDRWNLTIGVVYMPPEFLDTA